MQRVHSGLNGPYLLSEEGLSFLSGVGPGAYVLGEKNPLGGINVRYVGRADEDLIAQLRTHIPAGKYSHFKYGFTQNRLNAWHLECRLFHDFGEYTLDNGVHPAHSGHFTSKCDFCGN